MRKMTSKKITLAEAFDQIYSDTVHVREVTFCVIVAIQLDSRYLRILLEN